jgi:adenylate kinase family enzyme
MSTGAFFVCGVASLNEQSPLRERLGPRIMVIGRTASGKSTLAKFLSLRWDLPCHHLDAIGCLPETDWARRDEDEAREMHRNVIADERWILDGGWDHLGIDERLRRATAVIWLDFSFLSSLWHFYGRLLSALFDPTPYVGQLEGARADHWSFFPIRNRSTYESRRPFYGSIGEKFPHLLVIRLEKFSQVDALRRQIDGELAAT